MHRFAQCTEIWKRLEKSIHVITHLAITMMKLASIIVMDFLSYLNHTTRLSESNILHNSRIHIWIIINFIENYQRIIYKMNFPFIHCVKNISSKGRYISPFSYIYTNISRPQRPHISNVQRWIYNAYVFNAFTVILAPAQAPTQTFCLFWSMVTSIVIGQLLWGGVFSEIHAERNLFINGFYFLRILAWNHC